MILTCPNCASRFVLPDKTLGEEGRKVKCSSCAEVWFQEPEGAEPEGSVEEEGQLEDLLEELQENEALGGGDEQDTDTGDEAAEQSANDASTEEAVPEDVEAGGEDVSDPESPAEEDIQEDDQEDIQEEPQGEALDAGLAEPDLDKFGPQEGEAEDNDADDEEKKELVSAEIVKKIGGYLAAVVFFVLTLFIFLALHGVLAHSWKGSQSVYEWFGFTAESPSENLLFDGITVKVESEGEGEKIMLSGSIVNLSDDKIQIPDIEVSLRDEKKMPIESWVIKPPQASIEGKGTLHFEDMRVTNYKGAIDTRLRFILH